ncbi:hypothetical protein GWI33_018639 [Rhynchophorus ferrugineus]|uniref:Uncharacterized protein n=1 Tax=Rhynchophorus ferrugineus TaxID=354439 RepID=A0A834HWG8_RHYFE|nr:hypothetical protein GWI33_018639 [Rhynchophorus ferrugineus]
MKRRDPHRKSHFHVWPISENLSKCEIIDPALLILDVISHYVRRATVSHGPPEGLQTDKVSPSHNRNKNVHNGYEHCRTLITLAGSGTEIGRPGNVCQRHAGRVGQR